MSEPVAGPIESFCGERGLPQPALVHSGSSQVYKVGNVALRVTDAGRNPATLTDADIVAAAQALRQAGVSVATPASGEVFAIGELSVSVWHWVDTDLSNATPTAWRELGRNVAVMHEVRPPFDLAPLGVILATRLETRLGVLRNERPQWLSIGDLAMLHDLTGPVLRELPQAAHGVATVHGDFHHGNVLWSPSGPVISDLEGLATGSGAYDFAVLEERVRCYGLAEKCLESFVEGYGADLRVIPGFEVMVRAKQLISTQWCVVQSLRWPAFENEARKRVAWWRDGSGPVWLTNPGAHTA